MKVRTIKPRCLRCGGYNMYFDSHAGFAICPDCGWDTHRDEDYWYVTSEYLAKKWQRGIVDNDTTNTTKDK